jgi:Resolvase, N terminal domain
MTRHWQIRRQFQPTADGTRRWDQVYQSLLPWTTLTEPSAVPTPSLTRQTEVTPEHHDRCPGVDPVTDPGPNDCTAGRAPHHVRAGAGGNEDMCRDDGYSGATRNRPGLDRLRGQANEAAVDRVVITSRDRLARHDVQQMVGLEACEQASCRIECLDRPLGRTRTLISCGTSAGPWPHMNPPSFPNTCTEGVS